MFNLTVHRFTSLRERTRRHWGFSMQGLAGICRYWPDRRSILRDRTRFRFAVGLGVSFFLLVLGYLPGSSQERGRRLKLAAVCFTEIDWFRSFLRTPRCK